jgi:AbrB family looped-hinge helix DNA binding protein
MNYAIVTPNTKGQIVIPKAMREALGITADSQLYLSVKDQTLYIQPFVSLMSAKRDKTYAEILAETQGGWAGDNWPEEEAKYHKIELAATKKAKKAW